MIISAPRKESNNREELPKGLRLVEPYVSLLKSIPALAWKVFIADYAKYQHIYEPTLKASILHAHMKDKFQKIGVVTAGLDYFEPYAKQHMLIVENKVLVRFKKMDTNYNTSNIPTMVQKKLEMADLELFESSDFNHFVEVGYIPNSTWSYFENIVIKEVGHDEPRWILLFDSNLNIVNSSVGTMDLFFSEEEVPNKEIDIKLKIKTK